MKPLQMWGGVECTLNRVGDAYINQCEKSGHNNRISDLKLFKDLAIQKLRYPCLWETVAPKDLDHCDWKNLDERLNELQRLNLDFIAGFLHHGSGPLYTSLIDPDFPEKFATYARLFIQRYPWVNDFTPINEINTTARFSLLYGHWYPHLEDYSMYLKSLLLQCRATVLAMREIRSVNPKARLIQTDDIGKCQSTDVLAYQRDYENERRWLAWDLLCGKVNKDHSLFKHFIKNGINEEELIWFEENRCPPDVIGLNHYHLSNRYLDHRVELFPEWSRGGNGKHHYSDIGAIDTGFAEVIDPEVIIKETWERYGIPVAITECHTRGYRESQMRWLNQIWKTCQTLRDEGIEIEAVTAWSLLGTFDWHNLCTNCENFYEPGVFDLRNPEKIPQATALSKLVTALATHGEFETPLLHSEGIWATGRRILFNAKEGQFTSLEHRREACPLIIINGNGTLGHAYARVCGARNIHYQLVSRADVDITDRKIVDYIIDMYNPWAVINIADEFNTGYMENVEGAVTLARVCKERNISLMNFSSDSVFDGHHEYSFTESNQVNPKSILGKSQADCEERVLSIYPDSLMIRTSTFFSPWDENNFITKTLLSLAKNNEVVAPNDMFISPTYIPDLANESLDLLIDGEKGIIHLTNVGEVSWEEFAFMAAEICTSYHELDSGLIRGINSGEMHMRTQRPKQSVLASEKQQRLPHLKNAMKRYFMDLQIPLRSQQETR